MNTLHTQWRPDNFSKVLGQTDTIAAIQLTLEKKTCRSFILTGPSGIGKTTIGRIIGNVVGCTKKNIMEIDAATYSKVENMREVTSTLKYKTIGSESRLIIVDECHMLSKAAWNSLLKAIEEPPAGVYWVLCTTEPNKVPKTIKTRCQVYELSEVAPKELYQKLLVPITEAEKFECSRDVLKHIAKNSQGSPRMALTTLAKCSDVVDVKVAARLMKTAEEEGDGFIAFARWLAGGQWDWEEALVLMVPFKDVLAEGLRRPLFDYLTKVISSTHNGQKAARLLSALDAFSKPYPQDGKVGYIYLSVAEICFDGD